MHQVPQEEPEMHSEQKPSVNPRRRVTVRSFPFELDNINSVSRWKTGIKQTTQQLQQKSQQMEAAVSEILQVLNLPKLESFAVAGAPLQLDLGQHASTVEQPSPLKSVDRRSEQTPRTMAMTRENSNEPEGAHEDNGALVGAPMGALYEVTKLRHLRGNPRAQPAMNLTLESDFISRGKIGEKEAQELFDAFNRSLNHYLWGGIALVHSDLTSVRRSSSLLLAAILAVTALHIPGKTDIFEICYSEFLTLVSSSMLDFYHTLDGVRGLCIGAFWLSDLSCKFPILEPLFVAEPSQGNSQDMPFG